MVFFYFSAQSHQLHLSEGLECRDCTLRLVRQALEWRSSYVFWSCADVDIVPAGEYSEACSGRGRALAGRCRCDRLYYGESRGRGRGGGRRYFIEIFMIDGVVGHQI